MLLLNLSATAQNPCAKADEDRVANKTAEARTKYLDVIKSAAALKNPKLATCAEEGLLSVVANDTKVAEQLTRADIAKARGDKSAARTAYIAAITLDPSSQKAHEALLELDGHAPPPPIPADDKSLRAARRLLEIGRREEALKLIDKTITENPEARITPELAPDPYAEALRLYAAGFYDDAATATKDGAKSGKPIPQELRAVAPMDAGVWRDIKRFFEAFGDLLATLVALAMAFGFLVYVIRMRREPRLEIGDFMPAEASTPTQHTASVTAMVREALGRFAPDDPKYSIATVRETIAPLEIPETILGAIPTPLSPLVRILPEVFQRFARGRVIALEGRVHAPGVNGTGLTLSLTFERATVGSVTLWQGEFDPATVRAKKKDDYGAADYYALAEPAAIWLLYRLEKLEEGA